ncbi:MAG: radical SAM protein [Spirochaetales bacterium]|nr:radical SAM protein [Spirochaetales bacterium]
MNWLFPQTTLQIEPTRRCNLNCKICIRPNLNELTASLSLEDFGKALDSSNLRHVALHGWGEPLLNPVLFQMVKYAESQGVSTELTTNATLLKTRIEEIFSSGLSTIAFGLHKKENLSVVMPQIQELITRRNRENLSKPKAYVDIVIYRENQDEITGLIKASAELNVDGVVLHRVFNVYKADREVEYISVQEEKELFLKVKRLAKELNIKLHLPPEPSIPCKAVKHSVFVTCKMKVTPCPYLSEVYVGDVRNGGIVQIIHSNRYINFIKNMDKHPMCTRCPLGSTNGRFYSS